MRNPKTTGTDSVGFADRAKSSARAKQHLLEKFRANAVKDDPEAAKRRAERLEIARAREIRQAERLAIKRRQEAERAAEAARLEAEKEAERAALAAEAERAAERERQRLAEQKAARDLRYAKRKKRK